MSKEFNLSKSETETNYTKNNLYVLDAFDNGICERICERIANIFCKINANQLNTDLQEPNNLLPPEPPSTNEEITVNSNLKKGNFDYIKNKGEKEMFETAYQAISILNLWDFVRYPDITSFMWSSNYKIDVIFHKIEELGYRHHSGSSFALVMRDMQYIAEYGEEAFREKYLLHANSCS